MKYGAQTAVFKMIPGLEDANFARLGGIHRNTFLNSPTLLDDQMRLRSRPNLRFAGQITGVEGYVESAAMGLLAGAWPQPKCKAATCTPPPPETAMGALITHITGGADAKTFQPMNVNFGLFPPIDAKGGARGARIATKPIPTGPKMRSPHGFRNPLCAITHRATAFGPRLIRPDRPMTGRRRRAVRFLLRIEDIDPARCRPEWEARFMMICTGWACTGLTPSCGNPTACPLMPSALDQLWRQWACSIPAPAPAAIFEPRFRRAAGRRAPVRARWHHLSRHLPAPPDEDAGPQDAHYV